MDVFSRLGRFYAEGLGVAQDEKRAFRLFERGAALGEVSAQSWLGHCYGNGIGIDKNESLAVF